MTSSNKARRYLQHHKQHYTETHNNHQSAAELLIIDPTLAVSSMRKFRGKIHQQQQSSTTVSIPQICVDNDDDDNHAAANDDDDDDGNDNSSNNNNKKSKNDDNGHVAILNEFDEVLENELKRSSVFRTSSLRHKDSNNLIEIPISQQRSFSFALGSTTNLHGKNPDPDDDDGYEHYNHNESANKSPSKPTKRPSSIKASLSKETFSRLLHSLAFRSGNHTTSKVTTDSNTQQQQQQQQQQRPCLACQNHPNLDLIPKYKKRPSIFGVLVSKLNTTTTTTTNENNSDRCSVCKRRFSKSTFDNTITNNTDDDNHQISPSTQNFSLSSLASTKILNDHGQILSRTKRRRSLPSLFQSLFDHDHHDHKRRIDNTQIQHRPSFSSILTHTLLDSITREQQQQQQQSLTTVSQTSPISFSSVSLAESDDSKENTDDQSYKRQLTISDESTQLTEKFQVRIDSDGNDGEKEEDDHESTLDRETSTGELNDLNIMTANDSTNETNNNQFFLHPPEEKTRSLLVNVFRTRRSNVALGSNETNMVGKQFSVSVINLATPIGSNRINTTTPVNNESTLLNLLDHRKHALSEEILPSTDGSYIYFTNVNGQNFKERLNYSNASESTTLREILLKFFEKHHLPIETYNICLRSAPSLPLSLDQPVKHLLLDDLVVTGMQKEQASCTMSNDGIASAGSHPPLVSPLRRLSICRQLSDVLKYRRKSYCSNSNDHLPYIPSPSPTLSTTTNSASSTFTFVWNCALTEVDSPPGSSSNEDLHILPIQMQQRTRKNGLSDDPNMLNTKEITGSMVAACLLKQKSVSCDDVAFLSSSGDEQTICASGPSSATSAAMSYKPNCNEKEHGLSSCTRINNRALAKTSAGKERNEKRNSTGSAILTSTTKSASSTSKRLSTQCMVQDNDDVIPINILNSNCNQELRSVNAQQHSRSGKTARSGLFTGSIFTRVRKYV
ncbi:unnamed protein product [Rotaria magnacalcarata]|uniref:Uncharacterized protein n=2 Tax=Rotaria magnacalcarata TaxID=392030 RepID=A0A816U3W4_9BILA|nr:unnamed protein product [Rotaria magnacalcarata]